MASPYIVGHNGIHWKFPSAVERLAYSAGKNEEDRIAWQLNDDSLWALKQAPNTWKQIGSAGSVAASSVFNLISSSVAVSNGTYTKLPMAANIAEFDTNVLDAVNGRLRPAKKGLYVLSALLSTGASSGECVLQVRKNGAIHTFLADLAVTLAYVLPGSMYIYMNGTTDYLEFYAYHASGSGTTKNMILTVGGHLVKELP